MSVSGGLTVGVGSEKKICCDDNLQRVEQEHIGDTANAEKLPPLVMHSVQWWGLFTVWCLLNLTACTYCIQTSIFLSLNISSAVVFFIICCSIGEFLLDFLKVLIAVNLFLLPSPTVKSPETGRVGNR